MTQKKLTLKENKTKEKQLFALITQYEKHLEKALEEGVENLAEVFKTQIKILRFEIDKINE